MIVVLITVMIAVVSGEIEYMTHEVARRGVLQGCGRMRALCGCGFWRGRRGDREGDREGRRCAEVRPTCNSKTSCTASNSFS